MILCLQTSVSLTPEGESLTGLDIHDLHLRDFRRSDTLRHGVTPSRCEGGVFRPAKSSETLGQRRGLTTDSLCLPVGRSHSGPWSTGPEPGPLTSTSRGEERGNYVGERVTEGYLSSGGLVTRLGWF